MTNAARDQRRLLNRLRADLATAYPRKPATVEGYAGLMAGGSGPS
jgi:hypothetical protein